MSFSADEIARRQHAIREGIAERGAGAALLTSADNVYYATGVPLLSEWGRPMWAVIPLEDDAVVVGALLESETMQRHARHCRIETYDDEGDVQRALLAAVLGHLRAGASLGIEDAALPPVARAALECPLVDVSGVLAEARIVKSAEELDLLRLGGRIAQIGASAFLEALTPGTTELAVASFAVTEMNRALGALAPEAASSSYAYCHIGDHTLSPHQHPTGRRLRHGDLVALNVFPVISGYCAELERTLVVGEPTELQRRRLDALEDAFTEAKQRVAPGRAMRDVHHAASECLERHGLLGHVRHGTGHAHGIMIGAAGREEPGELRGYNDRTLAPGMVTSVEPGFYLPSEGGFRHSDVLVLDDAGAACITEFPLSVA